MAGRGIVTKEVVGIFSFTGSNGKTGFNIYLVEPFSDFERDGKNNVVLGMKTSSEFTYEDYELKVGDRVKIYKDVIETAKGTFPIIVDIVKQPKVVDTKGTPAGK